jgi:hypothetical protein
VFSTNSYLEVQAATLYSSGYASVKKKYSRTSIYRSRNLRLPAPTTRHLWSRIKFHINNVIYYRIYHSPNYRFTTFIACKSRPRHRISRMARLRKKIEVSYLCGIHVAHQCHMWQTVCLYRLPVFICYILFGLQIWQHSNSVLK